MKSGKCYEIRLNSPTLTLSPRLEPGERLRDRKAGKVIALRARQICRPDEV